MADQTKPEAVFAPMRPMSEAPRDGTPVLVRFCEGEPSDWYPQLQGGCAVLRFSGGRSIGGSWAFAAPVGLEVGEAELAGWWPLPDAEAKPEAAPRLRVKPLVWFMSASEIDGGWLIATTPFSRTYQLIREEDGYGWRVALSGFVLRAKGGRAAVHPTQEAAQAAAQTHHDDAVRELVGRLCDLGGAAP